MIHRLKIKFSFQNEKFNIFVVWFFNDNVYILKYLIVFILIELKKQNVSTQGKRAEELTANLVVYCKAIEMMGDEIFDLGIENETLREKLGDVDEKWLTETKQRNKLSYNDEAKKKLKEHEE